MLIVVISAQRNANFLFHFSVFLKGIFISERNWGNCKWSNLIKHLPLWDSVQAAPVSAAQAEHSSQLRLWSAIDTWCLVLAKLLTLNFLNQEIRTILQCLVILQPQKQRTMKLLFSSPKSNLNLIKFPNPTTNLQKAEENGTFQNPTGIPLAKSPL